MENISLISWSIGIVGAVIGMAGGIYFLISLRVMGKEIKKSMIFIFLASFLWTIYSIIMIFFAFLEVDITNKLWVLIPWAYTVTATIFIIGTSKLMKFFAITQKLKFKKR